MEVRTMRAITDEELQDILAKHKKWLASPTDGGRTDLSEASLQNVNLCNVDLQYAKLDGVNLSGANLQGAKLNNASLRNADLRCADLSYAKLQGADLQYADLSHAYLQGVNLNDANLDDANIKGAQKPWLVTISNIGNGIAEIIYFADKDNIRWGRWNNAEGGTLTEFKKHIDFVYPARSKNEHCQQYRIEYLSAIKMFESMREAYLKSAEKEKEQ
jgi:uncharacterized protein YjbI with pentapeptide repeats